MDTLTALSAHARSMYGARVYARRRSREWQVDLYERLGLQPEASDRDIKSAYRKMSVQYHPDKNPGNEVPPRALPARVAVLHCRTAPMRSPTVGVSTRGGSRRASAHALRAGMCGMCGGRGACCAGQVPRDH